VRTGTKPNLKARRLAGAVVAALAATASGTALAQSQPGYVTSATGNTVTTPYGECWRGGAAPKDLAACPPALRSTSSGAPPSAAAGGSGAERQQLAQSGREGVRERQQIAPAAGGTTPASAGAGAGVMEPGYVNSPQGVNYRTAFGECWRAGHWTPALAAEPCDATARASVPAPVAAAPQPAPAPQAQPQPEPAPAPLAAAPRGPMIQKITLETDVLFGFDKAELQPEGRQKLDEIADGLKDAKVNEILAIGYTDPIGSERYNEDLSKRRADAVQEYLVKQGVAQERIVTEGRGEQSLVTGGDCSKLKGQKLIQCFEPNRRVEIEVYGEREVAATEGEQPAAGATSGSAGSSSSSGSGR
jgi:OmpA-OmpF porin, OOP family